ncbi:MAG TPA: zinc-binding dehydrogenase [Solirubrobacteraceae bacterium]|nr:zinc-binding dehydrogenase [Solirubrobacteraceae bacterium]
MAVNDAVPIPEGVDVRTAAALLHDGPTALKLTQVTSISRDDAVLVLGASGGLGLALVQLARARARRVVAVARDAAKRERIAAFGPDSVIDPEDPEWVHRAGDALGPGGATVIFDNVGTSLGPAAFPLLAETGHFSAHATHDGAFTALDPAQVRERRATVTGIEPVQLRGDELAELTGRSFAAAAVGELRPVIGQTFALQQAAAAHRAIESRRVFGKTLLTTARQTPPCRLGQTAARWAADRFRRSTSARSTISCATRTRVRRRVPLVSRSDIRGRRRSFSAGAAPTGAGEIPRSADTTPHRAKPVAGPAGSDRRTRHTCRSCRHRAWPRHALCAPALAQANRQHRCRSAGPPPRWCHHPPACRTPAHYHAQGGWPAPPDAHAWRHGELRGLVEQRPDPSHRWESSSELPINHTRRPTSAWPAGPVPAPRRKAADHRRHRMKVDDRVGATGSPWMMMAVALVVGSGA